MNKTLPRILFISQHWPHRDTTASELRSFHVRRALEEIGQVSVVVLDAENGEAGWSNGQPRRFELASVIDVYQHPNRGLYEKFRWGFDPRSDYPHGNGVGFEDTQRVLGLSKNYDLIWFSKIRTAGMLAHWKWPRSVLDLDDVPSLFESSVLQASHGKRSNLMTRMRRSSWRRREKLLGERFTILAVCSEGDRTYLKDDVGLATPIHVIPNGFEEPESPQPRVPTTPPRIGFIGLFDYFPNVEGIEWFVRECWPHIKSNCPDVTLRLAGRNTEGAKLPSGKDIEVLGWVENIDAELATWSLMIVPLHKGAGTRGKIACGFSRRCPVVSTSLGAYGYEAETVREIMLADSPEKFAEACLTILRNPEQATMMAERAHQKFLEKWTWKAIQPRVWAAAEDCLRRIAALGAS